MRKVRYPFCMQSLTIEKIHTSIFTIALALFVIFFANGPKVVLAKKLKRPPTLTLIHTGRENNIGHSPKFIVQFDKNGLPIKAQRSGITRFLACHHTGKSHPMDLSILYKIYQTASHFKKGSAHIIAGYRAPRVARAKGNKRSPHQHGTAIDFVIPGVKLKNQLAFVRTKYPKGHGIGFYPNAGFLHLDRRQPSSSAYWIDISGPGNRAKYISQGHYAALLAKASRSKKRTGPAAHQKPSRKNALS